MKFARSSFAFRCSLLTALLLASCSVDDGSEPSDADASAADGSRDDAAIASDAAPDSALATDAEAGAPPPPPPNGVKDGTESDVDCGGAGAGVARCGDGKTCLVKEDCVSLFCNAAGVCATPSPNDGEKNGKETDVDCGGDAPTTCAVGKGCLVHLDCASKGCGYDAKCAPRPSCTPENGGATCRKADGTTESCCTTIAVPASGYSGAAFEIDKYVTTAGRMRAFLERVDGNVRAYITGNKPAWWKDEWTPWLPVSFNGHENNDYAKPLVGTVVKGWNAGEYTVVNNAITATSVPAHDITVTHVNVASAYAQVAGGIVFDQDKQGCFIGASSYGHSTYAVPKADAMKLYGDDYERWMTQAALDQRPINCTNWPVLAALCAFDGGKLINEKQYAYVYDDDGAVTGSTLTGGRSTYPWGSPPPMTCSGGICTPGAGYDKATKPHVGGYAEIDPADVPGTAKQWTLVGPGTTGFSTSVCRECEDGWINWQFSYQDPLWNPYAGGLSESEQDRRARDQSYFISVPGRHPKGASRTIDGDRVQDIAGLMFEAAIFSSGNYSFTNTYLTFGTDEKTDDVAVTLPTVPIYGGSFEGHAVGSSSSYRLTTKYGKLTARCVYQ